MTKLLKFFIVATVLTFGCSAQATTIIDNTGSLAVFSPAQSPPSSNFGTGLVNPTVGQTLLNLSGSDTVLDSFSLFLGPKADGFGNLTFNGYVADWDRGSDRATNILFKSVEQEKIDRGVGDSTIDEFKFDPAGGLNLVAGQDYVFFLSINTFPPDTSFKSPGKDNSINGSFVSSNSSNFGDPTVAVWDVANPVFDVFFKAEFSAPSAVPVPAALPLFGTGLALMGFIGWRRKRKLAAAT